MNKLTSGFSKDGEKEAEDMANKQEEKSMATTLKSVSMSYVKRLLQCMLKVKKPIDIILP